MEKKDKKLFFDFTPDPKVLLALAHTDMQPLDALCELIDNAIDSFSHATLQGISISSPTIWIDLPKKTDLKNGIGIIRIRDNGPGMTAEQAEKAIKAGFSGNNAYDNLGLFGMGFNISTSKLGCITKFLTARPGDVFFTQTTIDLEKINQTKSYELEATQIDKSPNFTQGTIIEISKWWPEGNSNHGFIKKLVNYGEKKIREELGRRYATILKNKKINILINREPCKAFEHCVWSSSRFVEKNGQQIPAKYDIDHIIGTQRRCNSCRAIIPDGQNCCPSCCCTSIRTIEERIHGWVGIQRFDDATKFGIDLIRNGRAIRLDEKQAFFEFEDEFKHRIKDYPIDGQYGRIIGEIHLDFVPVDFLKTDFQRNSDEWQKAIHYLRGESSLQPRQPGADKNTSYIYKLYQGYRKVRTCGKTDMYMGYWDETEAKPKRISREVEEDYYKRFLNKEKGYYDDEEWWKLVEKASQPPIQAISTCPECYSQNLDDAEICITCGNVLIGKECLNNECKKQIPKSAHTCPHCGFTQIAQVFSPWKCKICNYNNKADATQCSKCHSERGAMNPLDKNYLLNISNKDDTLSIESVRIKLADGSENNKIKVESYKTSSQLIVPLTQNSLPLVIFKDQESILFFINTAHPMNSSSRISMEEIIATEIAAYIYDLNRALCSYSEHNISNIKWQIIQKYWSQKVAVSLPAIKESCEELLIKIKELVGNVISKEDSLFLYEELMQSKEQSRSFITKLQTYNNDLSTILGEIKENGEFLKYAPHDFLLQVYEYSPNSFFNHNVWDISYDINNPDLSTEIIEEIKACIYQEYHNCIEAIILFVKHTSQDSNTLKKVESAIKFLSEKMVE